MEYQLDLKTRFLLLLALPQVGNLKTLRVIHDLRQNLAPTEEEIKEFGVTTRITEDGKERMEWRPDIDTTKPFNLGPAAVGVIRERLTYLDRQEELTEDLLALCDLFEYDGA